MLSDCIDLEWLASRPRATFSHALVGAADEEMYVHPNILASLLSINVLPAKTRPPELRLTCSICLRSRAARLSAWEGRAVRPSFNSDQTKESVGTKVLASPPAASLPRFFPVRPHHRSELCRRGPAVPGQGALDIFRAVTEGLLPARTHLFERKHPTPVL